MQAKKSFAIFVVNCIRVYTSPKKINVGRDFCVLVLSRYVYTYLCLLPNSVKLGTLIRIDNDLYVISNKIPPGF